MSVALYKINCPGGTHEDRTPSCAVYPDGTGYCFSCGGRFTGIGAIVSAPPTIKPEDLKNTIGYIESLPLVETRGLKFPFDNTGYYVVWPDRDYYKLRKWVQRPGDPKYVGARGHKKPWFWANYVPEPYMSPACILTEGEINALSLKEAIKGLDIISPGSATNFYDKDMKSNVDLFGHYGKVIVLVDNDEAGVNGAIEFHKLVQPYNQDVRIILMEKDANTILCEHDGKEKLKKLLGV